MLGDFSDVDRLYWKTFWKCVVSSGFILTLIVYVATIAYGAKANFTEADILVSLKSWVSWIIALIALGSGWFAAKKTVTKQREIDSANFYASNIDARIDRAFRVFYNLWREGTKTLNGTEYHWQDIDTKLRTAIHEHCNSGFMGVYLCNTGRAPNSSTPLTNRKQFEDALDEIEQILKSNLDRVIK